jgi:cob(I)alamin adenosyltransferase
MAKLYTRSGDDGYTGLLGDARVAKYHLRPEAVGTIDEASAALGVARTFCRSDISQALLLVAQRDLYHIMAEVSATQENAERFRGVGEERVLWLEQRTDEITTQVDMPVEFIVPGDSQAGALLSLARTVVRRAERKVAELVHIGELENAELLRYLNRLSSLCFVLELLENQLTGKSSPTLAKD